MNDALPAGVDAPGPHRRARRLHRAASGDTGQALVRRQLDCTELGFAEGTPDFRLCVLLQQTNEHLASVDRRLTWIEQNTRFSRPYFGRGWW